MRSSLSSLVQSRPPGLAPVLRNPVSEIRNEIRRDNWARSSRPVEDAFENVLLLSGGGRRGAQHAYLSDLSWFAGRVAGDESRSAAHDRADRIDARLRHRADIEVRPEKLFLSGHAEELSDFAIRHAALHEWRRPATRFGLPQGRAEKYRHAG